jgi:hypothetical protein
MGSRGLARRWHLFEFEDLGWFPRLFRDSMTRWLAEASSEVYRPVVPLIVRLLDEQGTDQIVDLCTGGSGPWVGLKREVDLARAQRGEGSVSLLLTDLFPNVQALTEAAQKIGPAAEARLTSVDARQVPDDIKGVRTLFTSVHHFKPEDAQAILADAAESGRAIGIFDSVERTWPVILGVLWQVPMGMLYSVRHWQPRRRVQLFFTYVLPLILITSTWDAFVSQLRAYRPGELANLTEGLGGNRYRWESGVARSDDGGWRITYVIGSPVASGE